MFIVIFYITCIIVTTFTAICFWDFLGFFCQHLSIYICWQKKSLNILRKNIQKFTVTKYITENWISLHYALKHWERFFWEKFFYKVKFGQQFYCPFLKIIGEFFLWNFVFSIIFRWNGYDTVMIRLWYGYDTVMIRLWYGYDTVMIWLWNGYEMVMIIHK